MDNTRCKNCPHYKSYYHGFGVGSVMFSHRCWWTGRDPANMKEEECRLTTAPAGRILIGRLKGERAMMTYRDAMEMNESKNGLDLGEVSLDNLLELIEELPGWDYPLAEDFMHELAKRAGINADEYFAEDTAFGRDYNDLYADATEKLVVG